MSKPIANANYKPDSWAVSLSATESEEDSEIAEVQVCVSGLAQTFNCLEDEAEKIGRFFLTVAERMKRKKVRK